MSSVISMFSDVLAVVSPIVAMIAIIDGVKRAFDGLRAKRLVKLGLTRLLANDTTDASDEAVLTKLRLLSGVVRQRSLNEIELIEARKAIEDALVILPGETLSVRGRKVIETGLHQNSRSGEERFTMELLSGIKLPAAASAAR
jgi:hypothetical protein